MKKSMVIEKPAFFLQDTKNDPDVNRNNLFFSCKKIKPAILSHFFSKNSIKMILIEFAQKIFFSKSFITIKGNYIYIFTNYGNYTHLHIQIRK